MVEKGGKLVERWWRGGGEVVGVADGRIGS